MVLGLLFVACSAALFARSAADIVFPEGHGVQQNAVGSKQIPLELILRLSSVENLTDFVRFVNQESLDSGIMSPTIRNRLGTVQDAVVPKNAVCVPEMKVVELVKEKNTSFLYFPLCTRMPRCGGCCASELLSCQPTKTETVNYIVYVTEYGGEDTVSVTEKKLVTAEKHLECRCSCAVKQEHCNQLQVYEEDNCRCRCLNTDDEKRCSAENDTKLWDASKCMCSCRETQNCSTGYFYDLNTCSCAEVDVGRRIGMNVSSERAPPRRTWPREPLPVLPLATINRQPQRRYRAGH